MPVRSRRAAARSFPRLENELSLVRWIAREFGYDSARELREDTKRAGDGFDSSGRSLVGLRLLSRGDRLRITEDDLVRYDDNIRSHLAGMNAGRAGEPITLRYFQHLAALASEHFLRRRAESRPSLRASLNESLTEERSRGGRRVSRLPDFEDADLDTLAFWMATGSGKTLLLHLNYRQFLHYHRGPLDNILLVTPNEGLSAQHLREARLSGIPMRRFDAPASLDGAASVRVIEITKLAGEKRGGGVTVPVEAFEGKNLVFVDEGHKGSGGEAWRKVRDALAQTGFTFEYSATFGQALAAAKDQELTSRYGKAVLFDYSYRWFYEDGYGKDFRVLNLESDEGGDVADALLVGSLLAFHEQRLLFSAGEHSRYRIASPLWVFVGGTVNAVYTRDGQDRSDVLTVCRFFHRFLNDHVWAEETLRAVLGGTVGAAFGAAADPFQGFFPYLRSLGSANAAGLYDDILERLFRAPASGGLELRAIRSGDGEIGLRAAGAADYFGVVHVGDHGRFLKLAQRRQPGLVGAEDITSESLFHTINDRGSAVNVLIGARRFIEGWNSWRVSSMGLLNIGRSEGSQIIQLFGRGVRLRGMDFSLKRSRALPETSHPQWLDLLETLHVFAIRAAYMAKFREYLKAEGIAEPFEIRLPFRVRSGLLKKGLLAPRIDRDDEYAADAPPLPVGAGESDAVSLDIAPRVTGFGSDDRQMATPTDAGSAAPRPIGEKSLRFVDWEQARLDLLEHARNGGCPRVILRAGDLEKVVGRCKLAAEPRVMEPGTNADLKRLQDLVEALLRKCLDHADRRRRRAWETGRLRYRPLRPDDDNLRGVEGGYRIRVTDEQARSEVIEDVNALIAAGHTPSHPARQSLRRLRRVDFDRHLYEPLLVANGLGGQEVAPPALAGSERRFVEDLRAFWNKEGPARYPDVDLFLLRNLTRGSGIGFFGSQGFYPDFILWLKTGGRQHIVFVEPHGMLHANAWERDEKARLHERLRDEVGPAVERRSGTAGVTLDSYIVSATPFDDLSRRYGEGNWTTDRFADKHILFFPESRPAKAWPYLRRILDDQLRRGGPPAPRTSPEGGTSE